MVVCSLFPIAIATTCFIISSAIFALTHANKILTTHAPSFTFGYYPYLLKNDLKAEQNINIAW